MILIALGSNISGPWGNPAETMVRAIKEMAASDLKVEKVSRFLLTAPYGNVNQPAFINAAAQIATHLPPLALLEKLHTIEKCGGRKRAMRWGPRSLDLDIIDYHGLILSSPRLTLPHPGVADRFFVLKPIAEMNLHWKHPVLHMTAAQLLRRMGRFRGGGEI